VFFSFLVARVADVDCILAGSEAEALILENNLIKKHRPVYNIRLKDDKTYVSIKVTLTEEWPRVLVVRRYKRDGNLYFGPYGSAGAVREMLRVIKTVFPLRTCSNAFFKGGLDRASSTRSADALRRVSSSSRGSGTSRTSMKSSFS
jgi:excinuclease UvrABC nuclease subunit